MRNDLVRTEARLRRDTSNVARLIAEQTVSSLQAVDLVLRDAAREGSATRVAAQAPRLRDEIARLPQVSAILVLDADGQAIARTNEPPPVDTRLRERAYFTAHRDGRAKGLFFSEPYQTITGGKWRVGMSRRLDAPGGRFDGVIIAALEIESFDDFYRKVDVGDGGFITLLGADGTLITRVPDSYDARGRKLPNPQIQAALEREGRFSGWTISPITNGRVLVSASSVSGFPLQVYAGAPEDSALAPWRSEAWRVAMRTFLTSIAMLVLIALAAWGLARREKVLQRLEQRVRQAEKMEAIGRLAGGIAHDFNNILGGILGYGEMLVEQTPEASKLKRYAQNVLTAANRARGLVDQILAYSRSQRGTRVAVDLRRIVAETLELVRGSLAEGVHLEMQLPSEPLSVIGDATQLHQVAMNLCTNALQALEGTGRLSVTLEATDLERERVFQHGTLAPGRYVRLSVEDSGPGMDEATLARIFEPFFTTKEVGKGTGLGLALVYGIVTDSGGTIDVSSEPGRGSAFTIYLPRADAPIEADEASKGPVPRGHGERVLIVDDEEALLAVTAEVLAGLGYRPATFSEGRAALAEFAADPARFDAVITDEVMPEITGTQLAELLHRRRPDLPVLLVSGYIGPLMAERTAAAGIAEILKKPVQARELAAALARALARAPKLRP
jgi:signal transduction histidine kinase/ActR/RegA family two-component response regulator